MNSLKKANFTAITINWMIDAFLLLGYIVEYLKGGRTLSYVFIIVGLIFIPMLYVSYLYKRNPSDNKIKYISLIGYFILYITAMFTTSRILVYVYMFPILSVYMLYFNLKLIVISCSVLIVSNSLRIAYLITSLNMTSPSLTTDYMIQFASVSLFSVALIMTTKLSNEFNSKKIESLKNEQEMQNKVTENLKTILDILKKNTTSISTIIEQIGTTSRDLVSDLKESENIYLLTDESIHEQTTMTQEIQSMLENTMNISTEIEHMAENTTEDINEGNVLVKKLEDSSKKLNDNSVEVFEDINGLSKKSEDIYSITEVISQIAEKTNLLSLNASIESARAGEAGKGFAVVANEIRKLANESKNSAENIEEIMKDLMNSARKTVDSSKQFQQLNHSQNEIIKQTHTIFEQINLKSLNLKASIDKIHLTLDQVLSANNKIMKSIDKIADGSRKTVETHMRNEKISSENHKFAKEANKLVKEIQTIYAKSFIDEK